MDHLRDALQPWRLHAYDELGSTNDEAFALRDAGKLFCPAIVYTDLQTAGRGRGRNVWHGGRQTLTVSFALIADEDRPPQHLPLIVGVLLRRVAAEMGHAAVRIKWPNDLLHDRQKLAGILCERRHGVDVIGIGMNVGLDPALPEDLRRRVTSLSDLRGEPIEKRDVLVRVASIMTRLRRPTTWSEVRDEFGAHDALGGEWVSVDGRVGYCEGVDGDGRLVLADEAGRQLIHSGTVRILDPN